MGARGGATLPLGSTHVIAARRASCLLAQQRHVGMGGGAEVAPHDVGMGGGVEVVAALDVLARLASKRGGSRLSEVISTRRASLGGGAPAAGAALVNVSNASKRSVAQGGAPGANADAGNVSMLAMFRKASTVAMAVGRTASASSVEEESVAATFTTRVLQRNRAEKSWSRSRRVGEPRSNSV